jgi:hypothetical protein
MIALAYYWRLVEECVTWVSSGPDNHCVDVMWRSVWCAVPW